MRTSAQTVVVGAGIVGVSTAWELARRGATDVLVIDQKDLFHTGGSTSHAPGGVFQNIDRFELDPTDREKLLESQTAGSTRLPERL